MGNNLAFEIQITKKKLNELLEMQKIAQGTDETAENAYVLFKRWLDFQAHTPDWIRYTNARRQQMIRDKIQTILINKGLEYLKLDDTCKEFYERYLKEGGADIGRWIGR